MQINHIGIWTDQLEEMKIFYLVFFNGQSNEKYENPKKGFESYFVRFNGPVSIEIMRKTSIKTTCNHPGEEHIGLAHLCFSVANREAVNSLTERLRHAGHQVISEPRTTGDGYYESIILDPDNNRIEIMSE